MQNKIMYKFKKLLAVFFVLVFSFFSFIPSFVYSTNHVAPAAGQSATPAKPAIPKITDSPAFKSFNDKSGYKTDENVSLVEVVGKIIKQVLALLGVVFAIFLIYGGILWLTAGGETQRVERAKNIIKNSIIGLIITLSAYAISSFVVSQIYDSTMKK